MLYDVAIVGCSASGMACAITAAKRGLTVLVLDKNTSMGKKLRATGNGKCNLANTQFDKSCYRGENRPWIDRVLNENSADTVLDFFRELGLSVTVKNNCYYPASLQAASVVHMLGRAMEHYGVVTCLGRRVTKVSRCGDQYQLCAVISEEYKKEQQRAARKPGGKKSGNPYAGAKEPETGNASEEMWYEARKLVLATGGQAAPQFGCSKDGYRLAECLGHHITELYPGLVPLVSEEAFCKRLSGIRIQGEVSLVVDQHSLISSRGEIQFTDYGISGICVFDLARFAVRALSFDKAVSVCLDFAPEYDANAFDSFMESLLYETDYLSVGDVLYGLLPEKLADVIMERAGISPAVKAASLDSRSIKALARQIQAFPMQITGSRDFEMAQVTAGGVDTHEVTEQFASRVSEGLYLTGELLDVDGACGGYNLTFAFLSGIVAGKEIG